MRQAGDTLRRRAIVAAVAMAVGLGGVAIIAVVSGGLFGGSPAPAGAAVVVGGGVRAAARVERPKVESLSPPFTSLTPATRGQMAGWLKRHFAEEDQDITIHWVVKLGEPESTPDGYSVVRFAYIGSLAWEGGYFVSDRRYTFTANGNFVRSNAMGPGVPTEIRGLSLLGLLRL